MTSWKTQNCEGNERVTGFQVLDVGAEGRDEQAKHKAFLGRWNYFVLHYNDECMSLYIHLTPQNIQQQVWTLM